jgi:hypothetical protein
MRLTEEQMEGSLQIATAEIKTDTEILLKQKECPTAYLPNY